MRNSFIKIFLLAAVALVAVGCTKKPPADPAAAETLGGQAPTTSATNSNDTSSSAMTGQVLPPGLGGKVGDDSAPSASSQPSASASDSATSAPSKKLAHHGRHRHGRHSRGHHRRGHRRHHR